MKKTYLSRSVVTIALAVVLLVALSISAFADTYTYGYSGSACNTKINSLTESSTNLWGTKKTVTTKGWYGGTSYFFGWHSVTDSYYHYQGQVDLHTTGNIETTHTFKASFSVGVEEIFGASSEYSMSITTSRSVTQDINPNLASGWYYYGARARTRDMKYTESSIIYKKSNGKWVKDSTETKTPKYGCMVYERKYYNWVLDT